MKKLSVPVDNAIPGCYNGDTMSMDIEKRLRRAVLKSRMSRRRLAKLVHVDHAVLSRFASGSRTITLTTAAKLAKGLGLELRPRRKKGR